MSEQTAYGHIVRTPGICGGKPRIEGHRIRVQDIAVAYEQLGLSADAICDNYAGLTLAQVHAALAYYHDHREAIDAEMCAADVLAAEFRRQHPEWAR